MDGLVSMMLALLGLWVGSVLMAYALTRVRTRKNAPKRPELVPGSTWVLRSPSGVHRARFLAEMPNGYLITAPMELDAYVPYRPGDRLHIEATGEMEAVVFRTEVAERDMTDHTLLLAFPLDYFVRNRRESGRLVFEEGERTRLNGQPALLMDLSEGGARVRTRLEVAAGEWVRVEVPEKGEQFACVLESQPDAMDGRPASLVRLIFADPQA